MQLGKKSDDIATVQRFLLKHGFLTYAQVNTNPGYFGAATKEALREFLRGTNGLTTAEQNGEAIGSAVLRTMRSYEEQFQQTNGRGTTYVLNPETMRLRNVSNGDTIPLAQFKASRPTAVIDAGHGAENPHTRLEDPGAMRTLGKRMITEESVTRNMAMLTASALNAEKWDVIVTRDTPKELAHAKANGLNVDMPRPAVGRDSFHFRHVAALAGTTSFVSLHFDTAANRQAQGTRIITDRRAPASSPSVALREHVRHENSETENRDVINDTSARSRGLYVLHPRFVGHAMSSVLIEMGFASNWRDLQRLAGTGERDVEWRSAFAHELAADIITFHDMRDDLSQIIDGAPRREKTRMPVTPPHVASRAANMPSAQAATAVQPYVHGVEAGEYIRQIAERYGVAWQDIARVNNITDPNHVMVGMDLTIPNTLNYAVQHGDTLHSIAKRYTTTVDALKAANAMQDNTLVAGDYIAIPHVVAQQVVKGQGILQTARAGAAPEAINACAAIDAKQLVEIIKRMNGLTGDAVAPGQTLYVPTTVPCKPIPALPVRE